MIPLDPLDVAPRRKSCKWDQDIIRERHHIPLPINEHCLMLFILGVHYRHKQRGFHVHRTMKSENRGRAFLDDAVQSSVLW
jgi:hypothetical protein